MPTLAELTSEFSRRLNDANGREDQARARLDKEFRAATSSTDQGAQAWQESDDAILAARARRDESIASAHAGSETAIASARERRSDALDDNSVRYRNALADADRTDALAREDAQIAFREKVRQIEREHPVLREQLPLIRAAELAYQEALEKAALAHRRADDAARDAMQRSNEAALEEERRATSRASDNERVAVDAAGATYQREDKNSKTALMNALSIQVPDAVRDYNGKRAAMADAFTAEREEIHVWFRREKEKLK